MYPKPVDSDRRPCRQRLTRLDLPARRPIASKKTDPNQLDPGRTSRIIASQSCPESVSTDVDKLGPKQGSVSPSGRLGATLVSRVGVQAAPAYTTGR